MKICHLITRLIVGGAQSNTMYTILHLNKQGHDVVLAGGPYEENRGLVDWAEKENIKIKVFPLMKRKINLFDDFISMIQLYKYFKKENFDIVHTHSTQAGIYGRIAAKLAKVPIVIHTIHGTPFSETRPGWINTLTLFLEKICTKFSTKIISNATVLSDEYISKGIGIRRQYVTIYSGIDIEKFKNAKQIPKIRNRSTFNIALISRVTEGKGHLEAYEAMENLDAHLFVVGDGDKLHEYKKKFSRVNITYMGYQKNVENILASCDLLILPSYREGTPRSITEAMAAGVPIIGTNIAGIPEQIEDGTNGLLIKIKDSKQLRNKILEIMKNQLLREKFANNSLKVVQKFSVDKMTHDIENLYKNLTKQSSKP